MKVTPGDIRRRMAELSDDELLAMSREDPEEFRPETLQFLEDEIDKRGLTDEQMPPLKEEIVVGMDPRKLKWLKRTIYLLPILGLGSLFPLFFSPFARRLYEQSPFMFLFSSLSIVVAFLASFFLFRRLPQLDRPLLVVSPTHLTVGSDPRSPVTLSWDQVDRIFPYWTMGKNYLGIVPKEWNTQSDSLLRNFLRRVERFFYNHAPLHLAEDVLSTPIEELTIRLSTLHQVGPKQSCKGQNLLALAVAVLALSAIGCFVPAPINGIFFIFPAIGAGFKFLAVLFSSS